MEEICHLFLGHSPTVLSLSGESRYRDFNKKQEHEVYGVGAPVLLPWRLFFPMLNEGARDTNSRKPSYLGENIHPRPFDAHGKKGEMVIHRFKLVRSARHIATHKLLGG